MHRKLFCQTWLQIYILIYFHILYNLKASDGTLDKKGRNSVFFANIMCENSQPLQLLGITGFANCQVKYFYLLTLDMYKWLYVLLVLYVSNLNLIQNSIIRIETLENPKAFIFQLSFYQNRYI